MLQRAIPEIIPAYRIIKSVVQSLKFTWNFKVQKQNFPLLLTKFIFLFYLCSSFIYLSVDSFVLSKLINVTMSFKMLQREILEIIATWHVIKYFALMATSPCILKVSVKNNLKVPPSVEGILAEKLGWKCGSLPEALTLRFSIPYLRTEPKSDTEKRLWSKRIGRLIIQI